MTKKWLLIGAMFIILSSCQDEPVIDKVLRCSSNELIQVCDLNKTITVALDTFSSVEFINDTIEAQGKIFLQYNHPQKNINLKWNQYYITMSAGNYEISRGPKNYLKVYSGMATLKTGHSKIAIKPGSQLNYLSGSHVVVPVTREYSAWIPDTLTYK